MRKLTRTLLILGCVVLTSMTPPKALRAQEGAKASGEKAVKQLAVYKLEFTVREVEDGKRLSSRNYVMAVQDGDTGSIRVGNRVPYATGSFGPAREANTQFQYYDVGINLDCRLRERENFVLLESVGIEISSLVKDETTGSMAASVNPVVRQARARVDAAVTPGKPTLIASLDDVSTNRRYEVEVTATKVK